jgi:hypothetical protein
MTDQSKNRGRDHFKRFLRADFTIFTGIVLASSFKSELFAKTKVLV